MESTKQIKVINKILDMQNTCSQCNFSAIFMYRLNNAALCPYCDSEVIETYKTVNEEARNEL